MFTFISNVYLQIFLSLFSGFVFVDLETTSSGVQGLLLTLSSGITKGRLKGAIWEAGG